MHLTCGHKARRAGKRIVLTGAMLPSNARQSDGPKNLSYALRWASSARDDCPGGVYGVFAGKVGLGMDLSKRHSTDLDAPLQAAYCSAVDAPDTAWLGTAVQGFVVAGTGLGGFHSAWAAGLQSAIRQGIAVVRSSRAGAGLVITDISDKDMDGMVAAGNLLAPKARIAL